MKLTKLTFGLAALAIGVASAASHYSITLPSDMQAGETQLKAGQYRLQLEGNQATFQQGKKTIPVQVTVEKNSSKAPYTMLDTVGSKLQAIELGGTNTKIVFPAKPATNVGE